MPRPWSKPLRFTFSMNHFKTVALLFFLASAAQAQESVPKKTDKDAIDVAGSILNAKWLQKRDTARKKSGRLYFSGAPSLGYSLTSGAAAIFVGDGAFYTSEEPDQKISIIYLDILYTQKQQFVFRVQNNLWTKSNKFNIVTDWRYYWYPQTTYGLGDKSVLSDFVDQTYSYIRLYQTLLKTIKPNWYAGAGFAWDYHYNIVQSDGGQQVEDEIQLYGLSDKSNSAGLLFNLMYDDRINSINPWGGTYANLIYRPNFTFLGSDAPWQMLSVDMRKYIPFPKQSENILAFWSYNWMTFGGNAPYLDLPATGWDSSSNMGRGYIQGRFRSKNLLYLESEYRFKISPSGLFGGVVFANAQSVTSWPSNQFSSVALGAGAGLRIKFNKYSRANICIDYAFGQGGSQGVFVNLGEVF
jgi:outer membrane protein assembly factor BamA